ncbi:MAG: PAS domain-containing sensor histidine kinase [Candidatus Heimdallarchaeaceae archaeon]
MSDKHTITDFEEFFDITPMSIIIIQDIHKIVYANRSFFDSTGYTFEDLGDTTLTDLVHEDDRHIIQERTKILESGGKPDNTMQIRIVSKDGTVSLSRIIAQDITFDGKPSRILTGINISAQPLIEQSPELVSSLLQTLTTHSELGFWVDDINDHTIFINDRMCEYLGYTIDEIRTRSVTDFFHPDSQELYYQVLKERTEGKLTSSSYELILINKEGRPNTYRVVGSLLYDRFGTPIGSVGFFTNIEATKKLSLTVSVLNKYALFSRFKDLSSFWENVLHDLSDIYHADGGMIFLDGEVLAKQGNFAENFNPQDILEDLAKKGENIIHCQGTCKHTSAEINSAVISVLHLNQLPAGFIMLTSTIENLFYPEDLDLILAFCSQISLNYEHHFLYLQSEEERDFVSILLDILSHDFLNANTSVHGYLELLDQYVETEDTEKFKSYIKRSLSVIERSERILQTVQQLTKIQKERKIRKTVIIRPILDSAIDVQKSMLYDKEVDVKVTCSKNLKIIAGDLLQNVFENIISNGIKYTNDKEVKLEIECIEIQEEDEQLVEIKFIDFGVGIPDKDKPLFFKRLSRGDNRFQSGSGLGLYMARVLINSYNGIIRFENRVQDDYTKGSAVIITLPRG